MKKTLHLYQHFGKFDEITQVLLHDEDIDVIIKWNEVKNSKVEAVISNGNIVKCVPVINNKFSIKKEWLRIGAIQIIINVAMNGIVIQKYVCEPLHIIQNNNEIQVIPEVEQLKKEVAKYRTEQLELKKEVEKLTNLVEGLYGFTIKGGN